MRKLASHGFVQFWWFLCGHILFIILSAKKREFSLPYSFSIWFSREIYLITSTTLFQASVGPQTSLPNPWSNWHLQKQSFAGDNRVMRFLTSPEVDDRVLPQEIPSDRKMMMLALRGFLTASTIKKNWRRILAPTVLYFSPAAGQNHDCILKGDLVKRNSQNDMIHSGKCDIWKKSLTLLKSSDPFGQTLGCLLLSCMMSRTGPSPLTDH